MNSDAEIRGVMTSFPVVLFPDSKVEKAKSIFDQERFHHIPVTNYANEVVGILSHMDFKRLYLNLAKKSSGTKWSEKELSSMIVEDIMTPHPICLDASDTIGLAADIFLANQFHALPVTEDGALVGILTTHDLLRYCFLSPTSENEIANSFIQE